MIREVNLIEMDSNFTARETQDLIAPLQRQAICYHINAWVYF